MKVFLAAITSAHADPAAALISIGAVREDGAAFHRIHRNADWNWITQDAALSDQLWPHLAETLLPAEPIMRRPSAGRGRHRPRPLQHDAVMPGEPAPAAIGESWRVPDFWTDLRSIEVSLAHFLSPDGQPPVIWVWSESEASVLRPHLPAGGCLTLEPMWRDYGTTLRDESALATLGALESGSVMHRAIALRALEGRLVIPPAPTVRFETPTPPPEPEDRPLAVPAPVAPEPDAVPTGPVTLAVGRETATVKKRRAGEPVEGGPVEGGPVEGGPVGESVEGGPTAA